MLPVCKATGTISAPEIAGLRTTTGGSDAAKSVPVLSGQLDTSSTKQKPRLRAKQVTDTEARSRSRRVRHICTPSLLHYSERGSSLRPIAATLRLSLGELARSLAVKVPP